MAKNMTGPNDPVYGKWLEYGAGSFRPDAARSRNNILGNMYRRVLMELCMNRFHWKNVPPEIDVRYLELSLQRSALAVWYWDDEYAKFFAVPGSASGMKNMLDEPIAYTIPGRGMYGTRQLRKDQCVPIWANYLRVPDLDIIEVYAGQLAELHRTIEINTKNARRGRLLVGNKNQRMTLQNVSREIDEGTPAIGVNTNFDIEQIKAVDLGVNPDTLINLHTLRSRVWNETMGMLGINNANQDKKERLVADEVAANDEQVSSMKFVNLNARRRAADEINNMYGLNVSVDFYVDERPAPEPPPVDNAGNDSRDDAGEGE